MIEAPSPSTNGVQQQLERLDLRHPSLLTRGKNILQTRHIKEEGFDVDVSGSNTDDTTTKSDDNSIISNTKDQRYTELFQSFARVVCKACVIPRKELFEAFGMAMYVHEHFFAADNDMNSNQIDNNHNNDDDDKKNMPSSKSKNTTRKLRNISDIRRVADLACSHGLLSWALMLLRDLDDQIRREQATAAAAAKDHDSDNDEHNVIEVEIVRPCSAICVDRTMPPSSEKVALAMQEEWPKLAERWDYVEGMILQIEPAPSTLLVGVHCCGQLSDQVIDLAIRGNAPLALVPCCHTYKCLSKEHKQDLRDLNRKEKEMENQANANGDGALTVDDVVSSMKFQNCNTSLTDFVDSIRIRRLEEAGYHVQEERIPVEFSPKNRIILASPPQTPVPVPEHVRYQSQYHIRYKPVVTLFNITFKIPVADTEEARHFVRSESGRAAANRRRRRSPPNNSLSLWFPYKDYLSLEQIHDFADKVVSRYGPAIVKEMDEHDLNNPVRPPVLFRHTTREVRDHSTTTDNINNNNSSNNSDDTTIKFKIQVGHAGTDREKENGYAQTYKIDYAIDDATGTRPQITKDQAKVLHVMLCRHVPTEFDGQVRVRQTIGTVQLEKDVSGLSTVLS